MSKALSVDLRTRVLAAISGGMSGRQAAQRFGVSAASASRWRNLKRAKGDAQPKKQGGDRRSGQTEAHAGAILRLCADVIDEFTRECIAIRIDRKLKSTDVIDVLSDLFILRGVPGHVRSDNGPEFVAKAVREWITVVGAKTAFIEPGSPWENGYCESFNSKLRDELLNGEMFYSLAEARIVIESWRRHYNTRRPHSSLGYRPPAPNAVLWPAASPQPASPATSNVAEKPTMH